MTDGTLKDAALQFLFFQWEIPLVVLGADRRIAAWSRGAGELLGLSSEEAAGKLFDEIVPPAGRPSFQQLVASSDANPVIRNLEVALTHREGREVKTLVTIYRIPASGAPAAGHVLWIRPYQVASQDLEDPVLRESMIRMQQLSAVGQLTAALAHQIRTPLHVIQSTVELMQDELPGDSPALRGLRVIDRNGDRIKQLSDALAGFSHYKTHSFVLSDLNRLVEQVCFFMEMVCKKTGVKLVRSLTPLPKVKLDNDYLLGAFYNLMSNAVEAMPDGGTLTVSTGLSDRGVVLTVADTGSGIDEIFLEHIGRPFFTTKSSGTGLGMYVVRQVLDQHKAALDVQSRKGEGTTMIITFPRD